MNVFNVLCVIDVQRLCGCWFVVLLSLNDFVWWFTFILFNRLWSWHAVYLIYYFTLLPHIQKEKRYSIHYSTKKNEPTQGTVLNRVFMHNIWDGYRNISSSFPSALLKIWVGKQEERAQWLRWPETMTTEGLPSPRGSDSRDFVHCSPLRNILITACFPAMSFKKKKKTAKPTQE